MLRQYVLLESWLRTNRDRRNERGATAVEYGLMVVLIAAVIVAVVYLIGQNVLQGFTKVNTELDKVT